MPESKSADATLAPAINEPNCAAIIANPAVGTGKNVPSPWRLSATVSKTPVLISAATMIRTGILIFRIWSMDFLDDIRPYPHAFSNIYLQEVAHIIRETHAAQADTCLR